jgi:hypothetical protein
LNKLNGGKQVNLPTQIKIRLRILLERALRNQFLKILRTLRILAWTAFVLPPRVVSPDDYGIKTADK